ncbi:MAG TPA: hypothetical protein VLA76_02630 [Candidatus Angelobacter sp.]|nr:hypothetical protein [Candidatus Angelobacter sp.]
MTPALLPAEAADGFVQLAATAPLHADHDRVVELLSGDECPWPGGEAVRPAVAGLRRYEIDLRLRLGRDEAGMTTFRKAALLDLGPVVVNGDGWEAQISWRSAGAAPLFPVFSGALQVDRGRLTIEGLYAPPLGTIGRVADRMLLHVAANGTARWLLHELDRAALGAAG